MRRVLSVCLVLIATFSWSVAAASAAALTLTAVRPGLASSGGGTVLTLGATGSTAGLTVLIDGVAATVLTTTSPVMVVAPSHLAGPVTITVTNNLGESASQSAMLAYVDFPVIGLASPVVRASLSSAGLQGTNRGISSMGSIVPLLSGDGRSMAFASETDLGYGPKIKLYVKDTEAGVLSLVNACGDCFITSITPDGSRVGFNVFGGGGVRTANYASAPYGGTFTRIDVSASGVAANAPSPGGPVLSADGRYAAFSSAATNLEGTIGDTPSTNDLFVKDLQLGVIERLTLAKSVNVVSLSADGRFVVFSTSNVLLPTDTNLVSDLYLIDREIGASSLRCLTPGGNGASSNPALSADGRSVAFVSTATNLVADDTNAVADVFVVDIASGAITRESVATDGTPANLAATGTPTINGNGRFVGFTTLATNLVTGDLAGSTNVFVRDRVGGVTFLVDAANDGTLEDHSGTSPAFSADGRLIAFATVASNLAADDTNSLSDIYIKTMPPDTPVGAGVAVSPVDPLNATSPIAITFDQITAGGVTSLSMSTVGPALPTGFQLSGSTYFDLSTTAQFSGAANLCLNYSTMGVTDAGALRLLHFANSQWYDITTSNDTGVKIICGSTTSFSPFAIAERFDVTPPVIAAHGDLTAAATSTSGAVVLYTVPTAQDDFAGAVVVDCAPASGSTFALGATIVTCSAADPAGNAATSSFTVTVADTTAPVITGTPTGVSVAAAGSTGAIATYTTPTATDDIDGSVVVSCAPASGSNFAIGSTTVICTATDAAGNAATPTSFIVTVTPPVSTGPVCSAATPSTSLIWPANHKLVTITINSVTGGSGPLTIRITSIFQDEPTNTGDDEDSVVDAFGVGASRAQVRAERAGKGDGRVYHISFTATDSTGKSCAGDVSVGVPHDMSGRPGSLVDGGALHDSTKAASRRDDKDTCTDDKHDHSHQDGDACDHDRKKSGHKPGDNCEHEKAVKTQNKGGDKEK